MNHQPNRGQLALTLLLAVMLAACSTPPAATQPPDPVRASVNSNPECPQLASWGARQLYGTWQLELPELGQRGKMLLRQHPEFSESLRGELEYAGHQAIASGDLEEGELNLDESRDGKNYAAFWSGQLVASSCGNEIRGTWEQLENEGVRALTSPFVLRRLSTAPASW